MTLVLVMFLSLGGNHSLLDTAIAGEPTSVQLGKIVGRWYVKSKNTDGDCTRWVEVTKLADDYSFQGHDSQGMDIVGRFEPAVQIRFDYLGILVIQRRMPIFANYSIERAARPVFSLSPGELLGSIGPSMPPGAIRTFAIFDGRVARGMTLGAADRMYGCTSAEAARAPIDRPAPLEAASPAAP